MNRVMGLFALSLMLAGCSREQVAADDFWLRLGDLCSGSYAGEMVSEDADDGFFVGKDIVVRVEGCTDDEIRMPLRVAGNHMRTWVLSREEGGVRLTHEHPARPGGLEPISQYGGVSGAGSTGSRMLFPADEGTRAQFEREGIPDPADNVWAMEVRPSADLLAYEMSRPERFFRLEFDTSAPLNTAQTTAGADGT